MFTCSFIGVHDMDNNYVSNELKIKLQEMLCAVRLSDPSDEAFACGQLSKEGYWTYYERYNEIAETETGYYEKYDVNQADTHPAGKSSMSIGLAQQK